MLDPNVLPSKREVRQLQKPHGIFGRYQQPPHGSHGGKYAYNIRGSNLRRRADPLDGPRGHLGQRRLRGGESGALSPVQFREELCRVKPVQNRREEGRRPPFW